jgi:4-carboxymuconolactone decarboxylase
MRLDAISEDERSERQREMAERIAARRGAVRGPYKVWLHSPEACERIEELGGYVRFESSLPLRLRELSLLLAARAMDAQYSWNAHVDKTVEAGIPREAVDAIARRVEPAFDREEDEAYYRFCHELLTEHFVTDATFDRAFEHFGAEGLVDAVATLGNYVMLGMCLNAFQVDLQPDRLPPFPDIQGYARVGQEGGSHVY